MLFYLPFKLAYGLNIQACKNCDGEIEAGELAVSAPKVGKDQLWHAACFTCAKCQELLVDLCYCVKDGAIYCERHYAELLRPRCAACDEVCLSLCYVRQNITAPFCWEYVFVSSTKFRISKMLFFISVFK